VSQLVHVAQTTAPSAVTTAHMVAAYARTRGKDGRPGAGIAHRSISPDSAWQFQGTSMSGEWPLHSYLELGAFPSAVPCVRLHTRQVLWEWGLSEVSETVELLASELVTNAVKATRFMEDSFVLRFWLLSDRARVMVAVWDANPQQPIRMATSEDADNGRGLLLVEALSKQWDWHVAPDLGGKVVWALV